MSVLEGEGEGEGEGEEEESPCLVTNYSFNRKDYLIKMYVKSSVLKLTIVDNLTSEKWICKYNSMYIEELTRRTGNYKKFNVFVSMLNSGMMKTSGSVRIELMSHQDLEALTNKYKYNQDYKSSCSRGAKDEDSRKYLILVYTVEFDRIHYPLALEYCGMPNARVLQKKIQYLEREKSRLEEELLNGVCSKCSRELPALQEKLLYLEDEKKSLEHEVQCLAAELGSRYKCSRFPPTSAASAPPNMSSKYLQERIKLLEGENLKLVQTVEQMDKKLKESNKRFLFGRQIRRCGKCSELSADINNCQIPNNSKPANFSIVRNKQSDISSRSSVSSVKYGSMKVKEGRGGSRMKLRRTDGNVSSSSGVEQEGRKLAAKRRGPKRRSLASAKERRTGLAERRSSPPSIDRPTQTLTQSQYIPTDQQLRRQIYDLVKLVESWSSLPNHT